MDSRAFAMKAWPALIAFWSAPGRPGSQAESTWSISSAREASPSALVGFSVSTAATKRSTSSVNGWATRRPRSRATSMRRVPGSSPVRAIETIVSRVRRSASDGIVTRSTTTTRLSGGPGSSRPAGGAAAASGGARSWYRRTLRRLVPGRDEPGELDPLPLAALEDLDLVRPQVGDEAPVARPSRSGR